MKRTTKLALFTLLGLASTAVITVQPNRAVAQSFGDMTCRQLWYERNAIYAEAGHCFKTRRGRAAFGRRCYPPYGRLGSYDKRTVARIVRWERRNGCR